MRIVRTDSSFEGFVDLVKKLDAYLAAVDGEEHGFYAQYNGIAYLKHVVVLMDGQYPVACGAFKEIEPGVVEVKRMYTLPAYRGQGLARLVLRELEKWASELGFKACVLETGKRMPDAISLYSSSGYAIIPNYGQYIGVENSVCFRKDIAVNQPSSQTNP